MLGLGGPPPAGSGPSFLGRFLAVLAPVNCKCMGLCHVNVVNVIKIYIYVSLTNCK